MNLTDFHLFSSRPAWGWMISLVEFAALVGESKSVLLFSTSLTLSCGAHLRESLVYLFVLVGSTWNNDWVIYVSGWMDSIFRTLSSLAESATQTPQVTFSLALSRVFSVTSPNKLSLSLSLSLSLHRSGSGSGSGTGSLSSRLNCKQISVGSRG